MKKNAVIAGVIVLILIVGGFAILHKSSKTKTTSSGTTTTKTSAAAVNNAVLSTKTDSKLGQYLATPAGLPLYTYASDSSGVSNCTSTCITAWPAYQETSSIATLPAGVTTITRKDNGQVQFAFNGMPLYTFPSDSAGHITGNGVDSFTLAKPAAASTSTQSTTTTPAPSTSSSSSSGYNY